MKYPQATQTGIGALHRRLGALAVALCLFMPAAAPAQDMFGSPKGGGAQDMFGPPKAPPYVAPNRLFQVQVPGDWEVKTFKDKHDYVEFRISRQNGSAFWQIKRSPVSDGARAKQLMVRAVEKRLSKLPHYTELTRKDITLNGIKGASVMATYWFQGNAQYPRTVEEIYLVLGKEAYELHFECFEPLSEIIAGELNRVYQSFVPRPPGEGTLPAPNDDDEGMMNLDNIPF